MNYLQSIITVARGKAALILFFGILLLGIFARTWEFRTLPPGLHHDEASIGIEAYYLYHYGMDRNGFPYPVHLVSWGSGQNALYAYLLLPFVAIFGLQAAVIRIPILLSGIFTLPLIYFIGKRTVDRNFGLFAMFCIAISPWHILLSRWGLESNLLPFFFSIGYLCVLKTMEDWRWFIPANLFFAICLYAYGTAYAAIPIFLSLAILVFVRAGILKFRTVAFGLASLFVVGLPILLFILINTFKLDTLFIGPISIPRLPTLSRFEGLGAMFQGDFFSSLQKNIQAFLYLLIVQDDNRIRNILPPYGYFYLITFPIALVGAGLMVRSLKTSREQKLLLLAWLITGFVIGSLQPVIVNRINIIFIPLILCVAYCIYWFNERFKLVLPVSGLLLLIAFSFFTKDYHSQAYRDEAAKEFYTGFIPAIDFARQQGSAPICVTNYKIYMPYISVLISDPMPPAEFLSKVEYFDSGEPLREVRSLGRYTFGLENCKPVPGTIYILFYKEVFPHKNDYRKKIFDNYIVYVPKTLANIDAPADFSMSNSPRKQVFENPWVGVHSLSKNQLARKFVSVYNTNTKGDDGNE